MLRKIYFQFFFLLLFIFLPSFFIWAETNGSAVVINEICWMGSEASSNDEWIELYNNNDKEINLSGWKLASKDGSPEISLTGVIPPKGFFILERTDDNSAPFVPADQVYKGALGNNGENLKIVNDIGLIIDEVDCSNGWFTGDNELKKPMERIDFLLSGSDPANWRTSSNKNGTPKSKNGLSEPLDQNNTDSKTQIPYLDSQIFINELMPAPEGNDAENEWIELYNPNNRELDISNWKIKDHAGTITTYLIPKNTKILSNSYLVFYRRDTKIILNNEEDGISLINSINKVVDATNYKKAGRENSYNRILNNWKWSNSPTPGKENVITDLSFNEVKNSKQTNIDATPVKEKSYSSQISEKNLATASSKLNEPQNKQTAYLIAPLLAIISGLTILFIKKSIN